MGKKGSGKSHLVKKTLIPKLDAENRNVIVVDTLGEYDMFPVYESLDDFMYDLVDGKISDAILRFTDSEEIETFFEYCFNFEPFTLVVEEISVYMSPHYVSPGLERLFRFGRHRAISVIGITQRPADVNKIFSSQADYLFLFAQREVRDLDYINKLCGIDIEKVNRLPLHKFVFVNLVGGD